MNDNHLEVKLDVANKSKAIVPASLPNSVDCNPLDLLSHVATAADSYKSPKVVLFAATKHGPTPKYTDARKPFYINGVGPVIRASRRHQNKTKVSQASRFCHVCSRTRARVPQMICSNFAKGLCRKVVCQKCFQS